MCFPFSVINGLCVSRTEIYDTAGVKVHHLEYPKARAVSRMLCHIRFFGLFYNPGKYYRRMLWSILMNAIRLHFIYIT
jgi:hypothetical protein